MGTQTTSEAAITINADGSWTYTPAQDYTGTDSFTVTVSDGNGGTATATITLTINPVTPVNHAPVVEDYTSTTYANYAIDGTVSATDADDDSLTYALGTEAGHGTAVVDTDGSWTYTPAQDYTGTDSFTVTVSDGNGGTATSTVTVTLLKEFTIHTTFKVGTTNNATTLVGNQLLDARAEITNNQTSAQQVKLIVALYDADGTMVNVSYISKNIEAGATESINAGFKLPSDVTGYTVKAFVWDGTELFDSINPLSDVVEISAQ